MAQIELILDDGHGKLTPGKRSPLFEERTLMGNKVMEPGTCFIENDFNAPVQEYLMALCKQSGIKTHLLAPENADISMRTRIEREHKFVEKIISRGNTSLLISIHANAHFVDEDGDQLVDWNDANGIETFFFHDKKTNSGSKMGERLARVVQESLIKNLKPKYGMRNRGVKGANFYMLRESRSPACLVEGGFMTNKRECALLGDYIYQRDFAKAIFNSIVNYK